MLVQVLQEANVKRILNMEEILLEETLIKGKGKINRSGKGELQTGLTPGKKGRREAYPM